MLQAVDLIAVSITDPTDKGSRAPCAVKESETDENIEKQITYFIVVWSFWDIFIRSQSYDFDVIAHIEP